MVTDTRRHLTWEEVRDTLGAMAGSRVTVRVVERSDPEMLVAVFEGNIGVLSQAKHPALFWPVGPSDRHEGFHAESPGFYLHRDRFLGGEGRAGRNVLVIAQGTLVINIRQS